MVTVRCAFGMVASWLEVTVTRNIRPSQLISPPAFAPFAEVRTFGAERRVVAVAGIEPRLVRQGVEHAGFEVVHERREVRRVGRPAGPAGEQRVAGEQV